MKSFYLLFSIIIFSVVGNLHASTLSGDLLEIQNKIGSRYAIDYYDTSRIDADIATKIQGNINLPKEGWDAPLAENSIQLWSKNYNWQPDFGPKWNKKTLLDFISALKNKNISKALFMRTNSNGVDPFYPLDKGPYNFIAGKALQNGILYLSTITGGFDYKALGPGVNKEEYSLNYLFYQNGVLYKITSPFQFNYLSTTTGNSITSETLELCEAGMCKKILTKNVSIENGYQYQDLGSRSYRSWLNNPSKNKVFEGKYNQFVSDMTKIWK